MVDMGYVWVMYGMGHVCVMHESTMGEVGHV